MLDNRATVELLTRDVAARDEIDSSDAWTARTRRLTTLLTGTHATETEQVRTAAQTAESAETARWFGTPSIMVYQNVTPGLLPSEAERLGILHPAASAWLDLDGADARAALIDASLAAIGTRNETQPETATPKDWN